MVRYDRYMVLTFSSFHLDAINLNNGKSLSSNQHSYLGHTELYIKKQEKYLLCDFSLLHVV